MDLGQALVAHFQAAELGQPGEGALRHPAVAAQVLARLDPFARDPRRNPPSAQPGPTARAVRRLVQVQLGRAAAGAPAGLPDRRYRLDQRGTAAPIRDIGRRDFFRERDALPLDQDVVLRARLAAIRRIRPGRGAPFLARTLRLSWLARDQSSRPAWPRSSNTASCSWCQTPARCQARSRRQQVTPLPQPNSWGSISQGIPLRSTKIMPASAARSGTRGRPPFGLGRSGGSSGAMAVHRASLTNGLLIPAHSSSSGPRWRF
jgi:hypothetical protein